MLRTWREQTSISTGNIHTYLRDPTWNPDFWFSAGAVTVDPNSTRQASTGWNHPHVFAEPSGLIFSTFSSPETNPVNRSRVSFATYIA
jgi:hypothetical protein